MNGPSGAVDVVNVTVGTDLGPNMEEYAEAVPDVADAVPYPGAVRYPHLDYYGSSKDWRFVLRHFYSHVLFGVVLDLMARLFGLKPR